MKASRRLWKDLETSKRLETRRRFKKVLEGFKRYVRDITNLIKVISSCRQVGFWTYEIEVIFFT